MNIFQHIKARVSKESLDRTCARKMFEMKTYICSKDWINCILKEELLKIKYN